MRSVLPAMVMALIMPAAACGSGPRPLAAPRALVFSALRFGSSPAPPGRTVPPRFVLYGDGTLLTPGATHGALPTVRSRHLTRRAVDTLYRRAVEAGLAVSRDYDDRSVTDAPVLFMTLRVADRRAVTRVVLPGTGDSGRRGAIARLSAFTPAAADLTRPSVEFGYTRLAVVASVAPVSGLAPDRRAWPFGPLSAGSPVNGGTCTLLTGAALERFRALAATASPATLWTNGGASYVVYPRPLLPGENGCADLTTR